MKAAKTILVIEDEKNQLFLFQEELRDEGYAVLACGNAIDALEALEKNPVDLILTDVRLPGGDATALIPHIRDTHSSTPVVVVSGYDAYGDYLMRHEPMVKAFFKKPVDMKALRKTLAEILRKQAVPPTQAMIQGHIPPGPTGTPAGTAKDTEAHTVSSRMNIELASAHRRVLISLRLLSLVIIASFLIFNPPPREYEIYAIILLAFFLVSILSMFFLFKAWLEKKAAIISIFVLDTFFISFGLYLTGVQAWDLITLYFLTIFICAMVRDIKTSVGVGIAACFFYLLLQYKMTGQWLMADTTSLLKLPFLLIVATFSGYLAADSRLREDLARRYGKINEAISEQADIATQKLLSSEKHLKELVRYHHLVLANIQTGIVVASQDETVRTFNAAACRITGMEETRTVGFLLAELQGPFKPVANLMRRTLAEGKPFAQENVQLETAQPEPATVSLQTTLLQNPDGETQGVIATLKDTSLVKQMELQLMRSERLATLGEMAAGVAHEIKNPLNAILGFSQRLSAKMEDPKLKQYADIIVEEVNRMAATINDVLEYNRYQKPAKELVDFNVALEDALIFVAEKAGASGVTIARDIDPGLPLIPMDKDKVKQVLLNLMINAVNAMEKGGTLTVRVRVEDGMLPADQAANPEWSLLQQVFLQQKMVSVSVRDTGCGIPKENIHKLFNPFFTTKTTGTGLGLSICHKIVESHGGIMRVESQVGAGSNFIFYLPLEEEVAHEAK